MWTVVQADCRQNEKSGQYDEEQTVGVIEWIIVQWDNHFLLHFLNYTFTPQAGGESLLIQQDHFPHLCCVILEWKLSPGKLPFPRTWNDMEMDIL